MPETYTPAQLADETQTLAENFVGAALEIEDTREGIAQVQETVDEINAKITMPTYQAKIVTPTTAQQLVEPDNGYDALSSVIVNPAQTTDLENWISRNDQQEPIYLELTTYTIASYACYSQTKLVLFKGDNVTFIGGSAFQGCTSLQSVDTRNVTTIGNNAFFSCSSLQGIDVRNVTTIITDAFRNCSSLQNIDIRNVTSIGNNVFYGCSSLQNIDIRNVTSIGDLVFNDCSQLQLVDCTSCTTPPTIQGNTFRNTSVVLRIVVATDTEKALFQSATNWSARASQIYTVAEIEALVGMTYDEYYLQIFGHARNEVTE